MAISASSVVTQVTDSFAAGHDAATRLMDAIGTPAAVLAYITVNHDAKALLSAAAEVFGPDTPVMAWGPDDAGSTRNGDRGRSASGFVDRAERSGTELVEGSPR